jgi:hypothetical protein
MKIKLISPGNYGHEESNGLYPCWDSEFIKWTDSETETTIWVDTPGGLDQFQNIKSQVLYSNSKYKIFVLMEPVSLCPKNYEWAHENSSMFDMIFSTYQSFGNSTKFKYYPGGCRSFIRPDERMVYQKTKNISSIVSPKKYLDGHKLRHKIKEYYNESDNTPIDYLNPPIDRKVDGLSDYRFELVIENEDSPNFTEKLIDSMLCGCIPIYWSGNDINYLSMFDLNGIVVFSNFDELIEMIESGMFCESYYESRIESIKNNFEIAKKFVSFGDVLWNYGLKEFFENHENNL